VSDKTKERAEWEGKLEKKRQELTQRTADCQTAQTEYDQIEAELGRLQKSMKKLQEESRSATQEKETTQQQEEKERKSLEQMRGEIETLRSKIAGLQATKQTFEKEQLLPVKTQEAELENEIKEKEIVRDRMISHIESLTKKRQALVFEIAEKNETLTQTGKAHDEKVDECARKRAEVALAEQKQKELEKEFDDLCEKLAKAQTQAYQLEHTSIPGTKSHLAAQQEKLEKLQKEFADLEQTKKKIDQDLASRQKEQADKQSEYEKATEDLRTANDEIARLEADLEQLKKGADEERLNTSTEQLTSRKCELERIQAECATFEKTIKEIEISIGEKKAERKKRKELCDQKESESKALDTELEILGPVAQEEYIRQIEVAANRVKLLQSIRVALDKSLQQVYEILEVEPSEPVLSEQVKQLLQLLEPRLENVRNELLTCAKEVRLEER
jgi:chromosome segregation ATPase